MHDMLSVWFALERVGSIKRHQKNGLVFSYAQEWLQKPGAFPISLRFPLQEKPFDEQCSTIFFDNLLPEDRVREQVAGYYRLPSSDTFSLLRAIGADCAGALSILPQEEPPHAPAAYTYKTIPIAALPGYLAGLPLAPLGTGRQGVRLSLAGAQSKTSLRVIEESEEPYSEPLNGAPGTHLIKPPSDRFAYLPENEFFCSLLGRAMGLEVPETALTTTIPRAYLVRRYDRVQTPSGIVRVHQEDFCQALGLSRTQKYQDRGGASYKQIFTLFSSCHNPEQDSRKFLQGVVFNYLIGNDDAHAKNSSLLYDMPPKPRLAPFYDLVCTSVYPVVNKKMALKINRKRDPRHVHSSDWQVLCSQANIPFTEARENILGMCATLEKILQPTADIFIAQYSVIPVIHAIVAVIQKRLDLLKVALNDSR